MQFMEAFKFIISSIFYFVQIRGLIGRPGKLFFQSLQNIHLQNFLLKIGPYILPFKNGFVDVLHISHSEFFGQQIKSGEFVIDVIQ